MDLLCVMLVVSVMGASGSQPGDKQLTKWDEIFVDQCIEIFGGKDIEKAIDVFDRLEEKEIEGGDVFYKGEMRARTAALKCHVAEDRVHSPITVVESEKEYTGECIELEMKLKHFKIDRTSDARDTNFTVMPVTGPLIFTFFYSLQSYGENFFEIEVRGNYKVINTLHIQEKDERLLAFVEAIMLIALDEANTETIGGIGFQDGWNDMRMIENEYDADFDSGLDYEKYLR